MMLRCWKLDPASRVVARDAVEEIAVAAANLVEEDMGHLEWPTTATTLYTRKTAHLNRTGVDVHSAAVVARFDELRVSRSAVVLEKELGSGEYGQVWLGTLHGAHVAVKTLKEGTHADLLDQFMQEARILVALQHPSIVAVRGVCTEAAVEQCCIVLELMPGGDLQGYLVGHRTELAASQVLESQLINVLVQIASAMAFLERSHIVHRDLAAR